jgi:hypothetical protein
VYNLSSACSNLGVIFSFKITTSHLKAVLKDALRFRESVNQTLKSKAAHCQKVCSIQKKPFNNDRFYPYKIEISKTQKVNST